MGRRGPAREPVEKKLARGETRPSRINARVPKPDLRDPVMPSDMSDEAKAVWRRIVRDQAAGIIRAVDGDLLACYCEAVARYRGAMRAYTVPIIRGRRDGVVANPLHRIVRDNADTIRLLARELGIGPSSRAGLQVLAFGDKPDSILDQIGPPPRLRVVGGDV